MLVRTSNLFLDDLRSKCSSLQTDVWNSHQEVLSQVRDCACRLLHEHSQMRATLTELGENSRVPSQIAVNSFCQLLGLENQGVSSTIHTSVGQAPDPTHVPMPGQVVEQVTCNHMQESSSYESLDQRPAPMDSMKSTSLQDLKSEVHEGDRLAGSLDADTSRGLPQRQSSTDPVHSKQSELSGMHPEPKMQMSRSLSLSSILEKQSASDTALAPASQRPSMLSQPESCSEGAWRQSKVSGHSDDSKLQKNSKNSCSSEAASIKSRGLNNEKRPGSGSDSDDSSESSCFSVREDFKVASHWSINPRRTDTLVSQRSLLRLPTQSNIDSDESGKRRSEEEAARCKALFRPGSAFTTGWELISVVLLLYDVITLPLQAFIPGEDPLVFQIMAWLIRLFWTFDIAMSFLTGYLDSAGLVVMRLDKIAVRYCKRQLAFDLVVVGCDWAGTVSDVQGTTVAKSWRLLRVTRLLRLKKVQQILERFGDHIRSDSVRVVGSIVKHLLVLALFIHCVACGWYALGNLSMENGNSTWIFETLGLPTSALYLRSLAFAASLFHGEVIIDPQNDVENLCIALALYFIFCWNVWLVSSITSGLTRLEIISTRKTSMFQALDKYIAQNNVSTELAIRVQRSALKALKDEENNLPESRIELLQMISVPLRQELAFDIMQPILAMHPLFALLADLHPTGVHKVCLMSVQRLALATGDVLFNEAESALTDPQGARMFFVVSGDLQYFKMSSAERIEISEGMWLAEATLWADTWSHCGTARAKSDCQLVALKAADFRKRISKLVPAGQLRDYANAFIEHLNINGQRLASDVGKCNAELDMIMSSSFGDLWDTQLRHKYFAAKQRKSSFIRRVSPSFASEGIMNVVSEKAD
eukprot:TRINITY_DN25093_c0_g1_i1.p1 TRINITY_DN25093_c0_g1~~TRINITY_DN25093_c0_g1_i1.p1  ORF type:complete len:872 (+),score=110.12 TRINITY_DN25093_c0_g1_i1:83-2698(+)